MNAPCRRAARWLALAASVVLSLAFAPLAAYASVAPSEGDEPGAQSVVPGGLAYVWKDWGPAPTYGSQTGFYRFDTTLTVDQDPGTSAALFWSHQFGIRNGDGGYLGLQTNGWMQGHYVGKMAIFSIWSSLGAAPGSPGSACEAFGGEGTGWSCRIPYAWQAGRSYRVRVTELCCAESPSAPETWLGTVTDLTTGIETVLGSIQVPGAWGWLDGSSVVWAEYYGSLASCQDMPQAAARFESFRADAGAPPVSSTITYPSAPPCPGAATVTNTATGQKITSGFVPGCGGSAAVVGLALAIPAALRRARGRRCASRRTLLRRAARSR